MDLSKSEEFFAPSTVRERLHILGCGSVGSTLAENLCRLGLTKFTLYDFDKVEPKNLANQMFTQKHLYQPKVEALLSMLAEINPDIEEDVIIEPDGYTDQMLDGYVFLAVDNIDLRRQICESNKYNAYIKGVFDFRTGLTDAQHFAADWQDRKSRDVLIKSMQFSHEDAKIDTPVSACNVELSVASTIRAIVALGVTNFMNFASGKGLKRFIQLDAFKYDLEVY